MKIDTIILSNIMILTKTYLGDTARTVIYNKDYDIIMLSGQSNMVGKAPIQEGIDNDYSEIARIVYQYDFNDNTIIPATNQLKIKTLFC